VSFEFQPLYRQGRPVDSNAFLEAVVKRKFSSPDGNGTPMIQFIRKSLYLCRGINRMN
jgi:hypothetical protein